MAILYIDGLEAATQSTAKRMDARKFDAVTRSILVEYTLTGNEDAADVIRIAKLPKGAVVLPKESFVNVVTNPGTTLTLDIGDAGDDDRYADGINVASVGHVAFGTGGAAHANLHTLSGESWITATLATAATLNAGGKLQFFIAYRSQSGG